MKGSAVAGQGPFAINASSRPTMAYGLAMSEFGSASASSGGSKRNKSSNACQLKIEGMEKVVKEIGVARSDLNNVTASNHPNHPNGKTPPWIITGRGSIVGEGAHFLRTTPNFIENP